MLAVHALIKKIEFRFQLQPSDLSETIEKKLGNLGFPLIDIQYFKSPDFKLKKINDNLYSLADLGDIESDFIPLSRPTELAKFNAKYNSSDHTITYELDGEYFVWNVTDPLQFEQYSNNKRGYISRVKIVDSKGKEIKKPKNDRGHSFTLEAMADIDDIDACFEVEMDIVGKAK
jgi:hypothetical protein